MREARRERGRGVTGIERLFCGTRQERGKGVAPTRCVTEQAFEERRSEGEKIASHRRRLTACHLGCDVGKGPAKRAVERPMCITPGSEVEIEEDGALGAIVEDEVRRARIAVNHSERSVLVGRFV